MIETKNDLNNFLQTASKKYWAGSEHIAIKYNNKTFHNYKSSQTLVNQCKIQYNFLS